MEQASERIDLDRPDIYCGHERHEFRDGAWCHWYYAADGPGGWRRCFVAAVLVELRAIGAVS